MCGLAGVVNSNLVESEYRVFEKLLLLSHWRGEDATGVVFGSKYFENNERKLAFNFLKDDRPSPDFIANYREEFDKEYKENHPHVLMGHCRWATIGKRDRTNAHPFDSKHILGMHNGTISGMFENSHKFDTDSEALLHNIGEKGLVAALEPLKYRAPAYALTWIDKRDNTLNFFRNSARPLWFSRNNDGLLAWASEKEFLEFVLPREKVKSDMYYTLKEHHLFSIPLDQPDCTAVKNIIWKDHEEDLKIKVYSSGHTFSESSYVYKDLQKEKEEEVDGTEEATSDDMFWILNESVDKKELLWRLSKGCSWCNWKLDFNTRDSATWVDENVYICGHCTSADPATKKYARELQIEYWQKIKEEHLKENPKEPFKSERIKQRESRKKKKLRPLREILDELEQRNKNLEALNDKPWDDEVNPSVH